MLNDRLDDYDSEPVRYCIRCYSLKIKYDEDIDSDYCIDCGCTDTTESSIEEWEKKYVKKYGHKLVEKSKDPSRSPIFQMPLSKLMDKIANYPKWRTIITSIYNHFPKGLSKTDSIILFFDKIVKDNKLYKLKELLYKMNI